MPKSQMTSPLGVCASNPRYFAHEDDVGVYLTGIHTWNALVDMGPRGAVVPFDWDAFLDMLEALGHNFTRTWSWNSVLTWNPEDEVVDFPWQRTGPGVAVDGKPKFDLTRYDQAFFDRVARRIGRAQERGIYVSVMFFESWTNFSGNEAPVANHVFAGGNNINGADILQTPHNGTHRGWYGGDAGILGLQKAFVKKMVETVNRFDNVIYEISNEPGPDSHDWQEDLTDHVRALERHLPKQHIIGQTGGMGSLNQRLNAGNADWIATDNGGGLGYRHGQHTWGEGPFERGDRPIMQDTDHLWGIGGNVPFAWKSFCRGYHPIYMDPWTDQPSGFYMHPRWPIPPNPDLRRELGATLAFARALNLTRAEPMNRAASSGYCLGVAGEGYAAYNPGSGPFALTLPSGTWALTWHDTTTGKTTDGGTVEQAKEVPTELTPPFDGPAAVLALRA